MYFRFADDIIFAHKPRLLDVAAQLEVQCTCSLRLGYKLCALIPAAGQRTRGTTFRALKVTSQVATLSQLSLASLRGRLIEYQLRMG